MKAVGYRETGSIDRADALIDFEADKPTPEGARRVGEGAGRVSEPSRYENSAKTCSCGSGT